MFTLLFFSFLAGIITILAPCIWPLLPLLLSASASEGKKRPAGIVLGIITSFTIFTLFLAYLLQFIPIDPDAFRNVAAIIIVILGITLVVPALTKYLEAAVSKFSGKFGSVASKKREGFWGGYGTGFLLGVLWSPCAGPILAAVATLAATQSVSIEAVLITLAFGFGIGIPLFIIATAGQKLITQSRALSPYTGRIQQVFGVIMIAAAIIIFTGYDKTLQTKILDAFPSYGNFIYSLEENEAVKEQLQKLRQGEDDGASNLLNVKENELDMYGQAPDFVGINQWLNVEDPLTLDGLEGKVVLVDFWTYSCINCIRTLPYVTGWYEKYKDEGFVVVGVHTPEFAFEQKTENVQSAIDRYDITYPVAQDNDYRTWRAYNNRYWPAHYLIDATGEIRYLHFGEGKYDETERAIQTLLEEAGMEVADKGFLEETGEGPQRGQTPETYLGSDRVARFASPEEIVEGELQAYSLPSSLKEDQVAYEGQWTVEGERIVSQENSALELAFSASKVFLVMAPPSSGKTALVRVLLDDEPVSGAAAGSDVASDGRVIVNEEMLYELIQLDSLESHLLRLEFETPGTAAYAFTFG